MTFDTTAFTDTIHEIRRDLERVEQAARWLAPCAYEQRAGGHSGSGDCRKCHGRGRRPADCVCKTECTCPPCTCKGAEPDCTRCTPCDECVVAVLGDTGEIVVRRHHIAGHLEQLARDAKKVWDTVKGMDGQVAKLANLIDRGASRLPGMDPPTVDPREVAQQVKRREQRVKRGDDLPAIPTIAEAAKKLLAEKAKQQQRIDEARAKRERQEAEGNSAAGNRWRR